MHDAHQALEAIREIVGLPELAFGAGDHVEVIFDDRTPVGFVKIDDHHFELVTPLDLGSDLDAAALTRLMTANYLGVATGGARLAVDPGRDAVALCQRVDVRGLEPHGLRGRLTDFLGAAAFWTGPEGREIATGPAFQADVLPTDAAYILRG